MIMMLLSELVDTCQVLVVCSYLDALEYLVNCFCECQLNVGQTDVKCLGLSPNLSRMSLRLCTAVP